MKKLLFFRIGLFATLFMSISFFTLYAQTGERILTENFNYAEGDIVGQGGWLRDGSAGGVNTLNIIDDALTHPEYQKDAIGKSLQTRILTGQKAIVSFAPQTKTIYLSALIRVDSIKGSSADYFLGFTSGEQNAPQFGKLYIKGDSEIGKYTLGVVRSGLTNYGSTKYDWQETLLIVMKYEVVEGEKNDKITLWINPNTSSESNSTIYVQNKFEEETGAEMSLLAAVQIRQSTTAPMLTMDALRVATSWEALFSSEPPPSTEPNILVQTNKLDFGPGFDDLIYTKSINIKGERLKENISLTLSSGEFTQISKNSILKENALSENGDDVTVQINANHSAKNSDTLILTSEGAAIVKLPITWQTYAVKELNTLAELRQQITSDPNNYESINYRIKGEVLVSHVYPASNGNTILQLFVQDESAAITINDKNNLLSAKQKTGDKLSSIMGNLSVSFGSISFTPIREYLSLSSDNPIKPTKTTLADLKANPAEYESRLIELSEVEFPNRETEGSGIFKEGVNPKMVQGNITLTDGFALRVLKGSDFIGDNIPEKADIIGISTAGTGKLIAPRSKADISAITSVPENPIETPNLLSNGSFELWENSSPLFGDKPTDWSVPGITAKESTIIKEGKYALKITEATQNFNKIEQEIMPSDVKFYADQMYELSFSYYVITSKNGNDVTIKSLWTNTGVAMEDDAQVLNNNTFFTSVGEWGTKTILTKAPKNADGFIFNVGVAKGVVAIFDNFSFRHIPSTEVALYINPKTIATFSAKVDSSITSTPLEVSGFNLSEDIAIRITGDNPDYFIPSVSSIKHSTGETKGSFTITYNPKAAGRHFANVEISSEGAKTFIIEIVGQASANVVGDKPIIHISTNILDNFRAEVDKSTTDSLIVNANNLTDYLYIALAGEDKEHFLLSTSMLGKEVIDAKFRITYKPRSEGAHTAYVKFYSKNADTVTLTIKGIATVNTDTVTPPTLNRTFNLDTTHPKTLWIENFSNVGHNTPIPDSIMQNVTPKWERPWWGFHEKDASDRVIERAAKATAYVYQGTNVKNCEMWLLTPALDFKNAKSKIFTFRVMGDFMFENHQTKLELFYIEKEGDGHYQNKVEMPIPSIPDENGDWREIHVDLTDQNIADVFFFGFRFTGLTGSENSVVYYIDDVSFGRTDLGAISCATKNISLNAEIYTAVESNAIVVEGKNLKEEITVSVLGANASKFKASVEKLGSEGGSFKITFSPMDEGLHSAYVKLSSLGAPDLIIPMEGRTSPANPAIIVANADLSVSLRLLSGNEVQSDNITVNPFMLSEDISLKIEGADSSQFRLNRNSIPRDGVGEKFFITYAPTSGNRHTAKVRLRSQGATDVIISLTGEKATGTEESIESAVRVIRNAQGFSLVCNNIRLKEVSVYTISGQKIYHKNMIFSQTEIPIPNKGCYFIKMVGEKDIYTTKVIW